MGGIHGSSFLLLSFCLLRFCLFNNHVHAASTDTILQGQIMKVSDTISSSGGVFELGFFSPESSNTSFFLGIWYKRTKVKTIVWVGNRDFPVTSNAMLSLQAGDLVISDFRITYRVSDSPVNQNTSATLLDSGNFLLKGRDLNIIWQSFDYPADTFLPGMKVGINKRTGKEWALNSWRNAQDPAPGTVSLSLKPETKEFIIVKQNQTYWTSGRWDDATMRFALIPEMRLNYIYNFSFVTNENETYFTYSLYNNTPTLSRCLLGVSGQLMQLTWLQGPDQWNLFWAQPRQICQAFTTCGPFSICRESTHGYCGCLEGFTPSGQDSWRGEDASGGCQRRIPLSCNESSSLDKGEKDGFLMVPDVYLPSNPKHSVTQSEDNCKLTCLNDCLCTAYSFSSTKECSLWNGDLLNLGKLEEGDPSGRQLNLKLAAYELWNYQKDEPRNPPGDNRQTRIILAVTVPSAFLSFAVLISCLWKRKQREMRKMEADQDLLLLDVEMSGAANISAYSTDLNIGNGKKKDYKLPQFTLASISAATDNFHQKNKLGQGGFGPVHKGKLLNGQDVAVKRLSRQSGQGLKELRNEMVLMAKLQHKNLVRIFGCCLERSEKILVYEYMSNRSLDSFLFDPTKRSLLSWAVRVHIIEGIAQGLLYLHEYSRKTIIHRDLKASNILLDDDMNPKISDFGLARMFGGNESQANTNRIVGTYGYMAPEYAVEGLFSTKSDVFSFGVLLLEILSGKKNTGFYNLNSLNLLSYAWEFWNRDAALDLVDSVLEHRGSDNTLLRYINVAFLCVQEIADDRPTMSEVVMMLANENLVLPSPKQPAFSNVRPSNVPDIYGNTPELELCSQNDASISAIEPR